MKGIKTLIEEVKTNPEFRAKFIGVDEAGIEKMLLEEGYDVSFDDIVETINNTDFELSAEEIENVAGGKLFDHSPGLLITSSMTTAVAATGTVCFAIKS